MLLCKPLVSFVLINEEFMNAHSIPTSSSLVRDVPNFPINKERLNFHLTHNDYFGVQATALGFIEERLLQCEAQIGIPERSQELVLLRQLRAEAIYLHENRHIINPSDV